MRNNRCFRYTPMVLAGTALLVAFEDPCTKTVDKMMACMPDDAKKAMEGKQDELVKQCKEEPARSEDEDKAFAEAAFACADKGDCKEYETCMGEARGGNALSHEYPSAIGYLSFQPDGFGAAFGE